MLLIPCPWCGPREECEFNFGGSAERAMPQLNGSLPDDGRQQAAWHAYVHIRTNPKGPHRELWHHSFGCERWIEVERDTRDHRILGACDAGAGRCG